jgi:hypothetical protein
MRPSDMLGDERRHVRSGSMSLDADERHDQAAEAVDSRLRRSSAPAPTGR